MVTRLDKHILKNGMVILGEPMEVVASAAFGVMLPAGAARLAKGCCGAANVISDWIFRGAGGKTSRQLGDALDRLGLHRADSAGSSHIGVGAVMEAGNLPNTLDLYADIILRPNLEAEQFELAKQLAIEGVRSLDDDPRQKVMIELRKRFYPEPLGRSTVGVVDELENLTAETTKQIIESEFDLSQTIFAIAGKYDFKAVVAQMEKLFERESSAGTAGIESGDKGEKYTHLANDGAQVHIGLMTDTVKATDEDYYNARIAVSILSGGMSARLFTEVREKRGLCYAIGARYHCLKDAAGILCYAGTTPDKAQETLDVITAEFRRLSEGISREEIDRAKVGLKAALILGSESSSSRAGAIGADHYLLGRVRSLEEIKQKIEQITVDSVLEFLRKNEFGDFTVVTVGPKEIKI